MSPAPRQNVEDPGLPKAFPGESGRFSWRGAPLSSQKELGQAREMAGLFRIGFLRLLEMPWFVRPCSLEPFVIYA